MFILKNVISSIVTKTCNSCVNIKQNLHFKGAKTAQNCILKLLMLNYFTTKVTPKVGNKHVLFNPSSLLRFGWAASIRLLNPFSYVQLGPVTSIRVNISQVK